MIVQMVSCQIGENSAIKIQSAYTVLCYRMGTDLHESIFTTRLYHLRHQRMQSMRVWSCMVCWYRFIIDIITNR